MRHLLTVFAFTAVMLLAVGCSDDDCPSCPSFSTPAGYMDGFLSLHPAVEFRDLVFGYGSVLPGLDSVKVGDSLLIFGEDYFFDTQSDLQDPVWIIGFIEDPTPDLLFAHGDTAHLEFWGDGNSASCNLVVLNRDSALTNITSPPYGEDTVAVGEPATVYWNRVQYAQYYAIMLVFGNRVNGSEDVTFRFTWSADTAYTVNPDFYPDSMSFMALVITPFTGPNPTVGSNIAGGWLTGKITSFGANDDVVIIGWNDPIPRKAGAPSEDAVLSRWTAQEIIDEVYRQATQ